jgi:hypothetical protein
MAGESIKSGLTAGFAASAALGALMVIKTHLCLKPFALVHQNLKL